MEFALNFLKNNVGIDSPALLSSAFILIALAYHGHKRDYALSPEEERRLRYWVLLANAKGRFSRGSSETILDQDLATLRGGGGAQELIDGLRKQVGSAPFDGPAGSNPAGPTLFNSLASLILSLSGSTRLRHIRRFQWQIAANYLGADGFAFDLRRRFVLRSAHGWNLGDGLHHVVPSKVGVMLHREPDVAMREQLGDRLDRPHWPDDAAWVTSGEERRCRRPPRVAPGRSTDRCTSRQQSLRSPRPPQFRSRE